MSVDPTALQPLGWRGFFQQQLELDEYELSQPARISAVHRSGLDVLTAGGSGHLPWTGQLAQLEGAERVTVGDWLVLDGQTGRVGRVLERQTLFVRPDPGDPGLMQPMAANVDVALLVSSCRDDFNEARLERYIALALEAGVEPFVVLTRADESDDPDAFVARARALRTGMPVVAVDARDADGLEGLRDVCRAGDTVVLLGSSGVGKSTLLNSLAVRGLQRTGAIREDDGKGRHTTTHRSLHVVSGGALVIDSPGIRELGLAPLASGVDETFDELGALARDCRFGDCAHDGEPGCAVQAAIERGEFDPRRLQSWHKLQREVRYASETEAERRRRTRRFGRAVQERLRLTGKLDRH